MILGLLIRYARTRKEILVQRGDGILEIFGHGEVYESLFAEEFTHLTNALESALSDPGTPPEAGRGAT
jgi:hypothetical protein